MKIKTGFSLIELIIVIAIIGILAAVSIPSYTSYITRTNRADAMDKLTEIAYQLERYANRNRTYTLDMTELGYAHDPTPSNRDHYMIDGDICAGATLATCVILTATPITDGYQADDGILSLNTRGEKSDKWTRRD